MSMVVWETSATFILYYENTRLALCAQQIAALMEIITLTTKITLHAYSKKI